MESPSPQAVEFNPSCSGPAHPNRPGTGPGYKNTEPGSILRWMETNNDSLFKQLKMLLDLLEPIKTPTVFLLSDPARYMTTASAVLKSLYPKLFHVTCVAYWLQNFAMKETFLFYNVNELTAKIKSATVKNNASQHSVLLLVTGIKLSLQNGEVG